MTFAVYVKLKLSIDERIPDFLLLLEKKNIQLRPAYNVVLYSVFGNENLFLCNKRSHCPKNSKERNGLHGLPSYEINIIIYHISNCCGMVDRGLMVDR